MFLYGPKHTSVISSPSGGVKEGSPVTLSCSSDANPAAYYTWFKNNQPLLWKPIQRYTFTSVHSEDRGKYRCQAENKYGRLRSNWVFIDVQCELKICTLHYNITPPDTNQGQQLIFGHIISSDSGKYLCEAKNELGNKSISIFIDVN
ncbi:Vascular cell adhesion protein 1 [Merluccius polli]|uniref:Vascular cell adhesion protein 1 n=1 Tax=Merluccius polli TaxID=89951 RepID=A0AA47P7K9_MERPO|nr:Vascular cell adhesion protein 1 [Merluccius polli]